MKIWLASYPRSGSFFSRLLLNRLYGLRHTSIYEERENEKVEKIEHNFRRPDQNDPYPETSNTDLPLFIKTHEMPGDDLPAIYLVRDGRDALVSYAWYILNFGRKTESDYLSVLKNLILDPGYFGGWGAHVLAWNHRSAATAVIKFEEIVTTPCPHLILESAFDALNFTEYEKKENSRVPLFKNLQKYWPAYFRKGQIGEWKEEMPPALHDLFWKRHGAAMKEMGYTYD